VRLLAPGRVGVSPALAGILPARRQSDSEQSAGKLGGRAAPRRLRAVTWPSAAGSAQRHIELDQWKSHSRGVAEPAAATVLKAETGAAKFREFWEWSTEKKRASRAPVVATALCPLRAAIRSVVQSSAELLAYARDGPQARGYSRAVQRLHLA
jgi:hypothetical protein